MRSTVAHFATRTPPRRRRESTQSTVEVTHVVSTATARPGHQHRRTQRPSITAPRLTSPFTASMVTLRTVPALHHKTVQQDARATNDLKPVAEKANRTATARRQSPTATSATPAPIRAQFRTVIPARRLATATQESSTTGHSTRERTHPIQ